MKPKKYLGQNFLKNRNVARKIVEAANVGKDDVVLEVGPGRGILTDILIRKAHRVIAVEKDKELADFLMDKFKGQNNLSVINDDILKIKIKKLKIKSYKIVANIPYYITSRFLRQFLESDYQPILMALMVQKEVGERIVAKNNKESILSISVKSYGQPKIITKVSAKNFSPVPKVDSAIIIIENISKDFFRKNKINEKRFFRIIKLGFSHKRKMLKNNLNLLTSDVQNIFGKCKIPPLARAEELSLEDWKCLYQSYQGPTLMI